MKNALLAKVLSSALIAMQLMTAKAQSPVAGGAGTAQVNSTVAAESDYRIVVGPNIRMSYDRTLGYAEPHIKAHPTDPNMLIAGAINSFRWADGYNQCKAFASRDGGYTWLDTDIRQRSGPAAGEGRGCDTWVGFGKTGTAVYAHLSAGELTKEGKRISPNTVNRSTDGGLTWESSADLRIADRESLTVDTVSQRFGGRMYLVPTGGQSCKDKLKAQFGRAENFGVCVRRSEDDGRTWSEPVILEGEHQQIALEAHVFSDGTVIVTCKGALDPRPKTGPNVGIFYYISRDGGVTFEKRKQVISKTGVMFQPLGTMPDVVDAVSSRFRDRMYMLVNRPGQTAENASWANQRLYITHSDNKGETWSEPRRIDIGTPPESLISKPEIAVNRDGVVGVTWFDLRDAKRSGDYNVYFTASVDGGETFLPATRVSSATINPLDASNGSTRAYAPVAPFTKDNVRIPPENYNLIDATTRYEEDGTIAIRRGVWGHRGPGGDYNGLTADASGVFHPIWADSRDGGIYQLYTTRIRVEPVPKSKPALEQQVISSSSVQFVFGRGHFDPATRVWELPIRIKNKGSVPWYGPLTVTIADIKNPEAAEIIAQRRMMLEPGEPVAGNMTIAEPEEGEAEEYLPTEATIVNSVNGVEGKGSMFDFTPALGPLSRLLPGEQSENMVWKFRIAVPDVWGNTGGYQVPLILTPEVRAMVEKKAANQ